MEHRQTLVAKPQLSGKTCEVTVEYERTCKGCSWSPRTETETMQVPVNDKEAYVIDLFAWFNAEERAIEALPHNDLGEKNQYVAEQRFFNRFVENRVLA